MIIDKAGVGQMLLCAAKEIASQVDYLNEIDARFGDGDHGITIGKIAKYIQETVPTWGDEPLQEALSDLGDGIMGVRGGSAGPLYGTMVGGLGAHLAPDAMEIDEAGVRAMFAGSLEEMEGISTAKVGDKTMMDSLIPAVAAAQTAEGDCKAILAAAAQAAQEGSKASEGFISKFGRARSYKEQTLGTPDAGAVSTSYFIKGLAEGI